MNMAMQAMAQACIKRLRLHVSGALAAICVVAGANVATAQTCPDNTLCTYVFPLPPCPPASVGDPRTCGGTLLFAAGKTAVSVDYTLASVAQPPLGLAAGEAAFVYLQATSMATAFDRIESRGAMVQSYNGAALVMQSETTVGAQCAAVLPSHIASLGTDFRTAGFALNQSNGDDTGFDYAALYAPQDCNIVARAPAAAYAKLQAQAPGSRFWHAAAGPEVRLHMAAGSSVLLRTQGAGRALGAHGFPIDGARILADAPIAAAVGGRGCVVDANNTVLGCEDAFEGIVPVHRLGRNYVVGQFPGLQGQQVRVVADTPNTEVRCNGTLVAVLDAGETHIFVPTAVTRVETSANVLVLQTAGLVKAGGDFALVHPMVSDLGLPTEVSFALFTDDAGYLFVVLPTKAVSTLRLDGIDFRNMADASVVQVPGENDWSAVSLPQIGAGTHMVTAQGSMQASLIVANLASGSGSFSYTTPLRRPGCGDGVVEVTEACDDSNIEEFDGCTSMCDVAPGYTCNGTPSVCTWVGADTNPNSPAPATFPEVSPTDVSCSVVGCPLGQYCDAAGCLPQQRNARLCVSDSQCLGQVCAHDGRCGLEDGVACVDAASCRSAVCDEGVCVDLGARAVGDGLSGCNAVATGTAVGWRDAGAVLALSFAWAFWRHRRKSRRFASHTPATMWRRKKSRSRHYICGFIGIASLGWLHIAHAADAATGLNLVPLPDQQSGAPWLVADGFVPPRGPLNAPAETTFRLGGIYAPRPLVMRHSDGGGILGTVIAHQATLRATATLWWHRALRLSLSLPVQVYATGGPVAGSPVAFAAPRHPVAAGDLVLSAAWPFWHAPRGLLRTVAAASLIVPTGSPASYAADGVAAGVVRLAAVGRSGPWNYAVSLAGHGRSPAMVAGIPVGPFQLSATAALGHYFCRELLHVGVEVPLGTMLRPHYRAFAANTSVVDPTLSLRYAPGPVWAYMLGASTSLSRGPGETHWRVLAAMDITPWKAHLRQIPAQGVAAVNFPGLSEDLKTQAGVLADLQATAPAALEGLPVPPSALPTAVVSPKLPVALDTASLPSPFPTRPPPASTPESAAPPRYSAAPLPYRVQFAAKRADIVPVSKATLQQVHQFLKTASPQIRLRIVGFTDASGPADYNSVLSLRRAQAVCRALVAMGMPMARLKVFGLGAQSFIADNQTAAGREANRRVEFFADEFRSD